MNAHVLMTLTRGAEVLAQALAERADVTFIAFHDAVVPYMERRGIPCRAFTEFMPECAKTACLAEAGARREALRAIVRSDSFRASWPEYAEDPMSWDALAGILERQAIDQDILPEIAIIDGFRRIARETDLRLLIVQQDISRDTRPIVQTARRLGVPSLHILHGYPYGAVNAINMAVRGGECDAVALYSEENKKAFTYLGFDPSRLVVTGNFEWDALARPPRPSFRAAMCKELDLDPHRPIITYAITYTHGHSSISARNPGYVTRTTEAVLNAFASLHQTYPDWQFVLRPHPNDLLTRHTLEEQARDAGLERVLIDRNSSSQSCVAVSDVVVCCQSNLGIEAILAGKPIVNCVLDAFAQDVFDEGIGRLFRASDAVLHARTPAAIGLAVEAALLDPIAREWFTERRPATLQRLNYRNDRRATERTCALVLDMIERGRKLFRKIERWPEFEPALVRCIPSDAKRVLLAGGDTPALEDRVRAGLPHATVDAVPDIDAAPGAFYSTVVLAAPLPHSDRTEQILRRARACLEQQGTVVCIFLNGASPCAWESVTRGVWTPARTETGATANWGEYSPPGVTLALSRCDLDIERSEPRLHSIDAATCGETAWVVRARLRNAHPSPWGTERAARRAEALSLNARGESCFRAGDYNAAAGAFAAAIAVWDKEAILYNNLGTVMHLLRRHEEAYHHFRTALHFDPSLEAARENLRALAPVLGLSEDAERILDCFGASGGSVRH